MYALIFKRLLCKVYKMRIDEMEKLPPNHPDHIPSDKKAEDEPIAFKVGQRVTVTGGKHKKLIKDDEVCVISTVKSTFCEIQIQGPESVNGRKANVHRKFISPAGEPKPDPVVVQEPVQEDVHTMPVVETDCVVVEKQEETPDQSGETNITTEIREVLEEAIKNQPTAEEDAMVQSPTDVLKEVSDGLRDIAEDLRLTESEMSDKDEIVRLKGVISDLEADIVSYRDMMLGHQNELEYLRKETGPSQEEKKLKNEKLIECIKILLTLQ